MIEDRPVRRPQGDRPKKRDVNGWIILDKGVGMTSTHAVAVVKRGLSAKKAGHAGTLDPLASGILPIALGEATKTVPFVMDGRKSYVFTVAWGEETTTDDTEGEVVERDRTGCRTRPRSRPILPRFTGQVQQVPPRFSAIKIAGERAYDLARDGEVVELQARTVEIDRLSLIHHDGQPLGDRGRLRQGHLCARHRPRSRPRARLPRAYRGTPAHPRRTVHRARRGHRGRRRHRSGSAAPGGDGPERNPVDRGQPRHGRRDSCAASRSSCADARRRSPARSTPPATAILVAVGDVERGELVPHRVFNLGA